jgi:hypothetical protein
MNSEPKELHLRRKQKIQEDKDFTSARISESARYVGFGLAALTVAMLTSDAAFPKRLIAAHGNFVILASAFGCITVISDYLHYLFGYYASEEAAGNVSGDFGYRTQSLFYKLRRGFFWTKQIFAVVGACIFIAILLLTMS